MQGMRPVAYDSEKHDHPIVAPYQQSRMMNHVMREGVSPSSNYKQPSSNQLLPFSLNDDTQEDMVSSSLFRLASPAKLSPINPPLEDLSPRWRAAAGLLQHNMIPVPEEDHEMYHKSSHYKVEDMNLKPMKMLNDNVAPLKMLPIGDSSPNYSHFGGGTYFGPTVLNKYGGLRDYFTPQANQLRTQNYANLPGHTSSKSSKFQQGVKKAKGLGKVVTGFSMLSKSAIKNQEVDIRESNN